MKKKLIWIAAALLVVAVVAPLTASDAQSWTGWITDSHCGAQGANAKHTKACVEKCAKDGKVQFFNNADKTLYDIDKAQEAMEHVGHEVKITGVVEGGAIKVASIERVEKAG